MAKKYSKNEFPYARPLASALLADVNFREWFLGGTTFGANAREACPLAKDHRHSRRLTGNDERAEVFPKALDLGFGTFLPFGFFNYVRQAEGHSSR